MQWMEERFEGRHGVDGECHGLFGRDAHGDLGECGDVEERVFLEVGHVMCGIEKVVEAEDCVVDLVA